MPEPWELDVAAAREALDREDLSAFDLLAACLRRIDELDSGVRAWEYVDPALAAGYARSAPAGPLQGIPVGIKDIFNTSDMPTTMGSPVWATFTPGNDARVVHYARLAGSVVIGKTVTAEFAVHAPGETRNPHDLDRSPGTSSSGSAAAVACGMVPWALGSQTAGSIIRPASYCGIYGFKPSYGVLPRTGMLKTTDTLDSIGFFTRSARDLRPLLDVLRVKGADYPLIHATLDRHQANGSKDKPRIGLVTDSLDVWASASEQAGRGLRDFAARIAGEVVVEEARAPVELNEVHQVHEKIYDRCIAYYFDKESREGTLVSPQIQKMVKRGREISTEEYAEMLGRQEELRTVYQRWAADYDAFLTLSTSGPAHALKAVDGPDSALIWTLCGAPTVGLPVLSHDPGLPLGAQLVGHRFADHELLDLVDGLDRAGHLPPVAPVTPEVTRPSDPPGLKAQF
jgi:Asp-tRNA(Asn)/Glu-tRNA(Gln) amidotransferase A subunit family amidase